MKDPTRDPTESTAERLRMRALLLDLIDRRRLETKDPGLGWRIEQEILSRELKELEAEISANPGALRRLIRKSRI
jgi:hypothetical protein